MRDERDGSRELGRKGWFLLVVLGLGLPYLFWTHVFSLARMVSNSMKPALQIGPEGSDLVLVDRFSTRWRAPLRGEIVHFQGADGGEDRTREGVLVLKRVVGLPGETVELRDGEVLINGTPLSGPREITEQKYVNDGHLEAGVRLEVGVDHYLVLGDDSRDSYDSRFWGCLPRSEIRGLAAAIVWPPGRIRSLRLSSSAPAAHP